MCEGASQSADLTCLSRPSRRRAARKLLIPTEDDFDEFEIGVPWTSVPASQIDGVGGGVLGTRAGPAGRTPYICEASPNKKLIAGCSGSG